MIGGKVIYDVCERSFLCFLCEFITQQCETLACGTYCNQVRLCIGYGYDAGGLVDSQSVALLIVELGEPL